MSVEKSKSPRGVITDEVLADFEEFEKGLESMDHAYELECMWLRTEIQELNRRDVKHGDGDLSNKARRVLEMGVRHIMEDRPSKEFLQWVAVSMTRTLNHSARSLDDAFRLANPTNRPKKDAYSDEHIKAAIAFIQSMDMDRAAGAAGNPNDARNKAIDLAYAVRWKESVGNHQAKRVDAETIRNRRRTIDRQLAKLGY